MTSVEIAPSTAAPPRMNPDLHRELVTELSAGGWDFPWRLSPGATAPISDPGARHAAWTLEAMLERPVRGALAMGRDRRAALELACGEGRLCHRLLAWNATRVVGVERDERRLRRARLLQRHFALPTSRLELRAPKDLTQLRATASPTFEVVLAVGVPERTDDIDQLASLAAACARTVCMVESGRDHLSQVAAGLRDAGFNELTRVAPPTDGERRYVLGDRAVLAARRTAP
jgi:hypothetical protein